MNDRKLNIDLAQIRGLYPRLQDYFGIWAIRPEPFLQAVERVNVLDLVTHIQGRADRILHSEGGTASFSHAADPYPVHDGIAMLEAVGTLMKVESSFEESTSTVKLRQQIRAAGDDPEVAGILLRIESPGGTSAGTSDVAEEAARAAAKKPVYAYAEDLCCSAAYWLASQCTAIYGNTTLAAPCIGTFSVVQDFSAAAAEQGVKVHVIRAGAFKGAGTPGTEVTAEQLAEWQRVVNQLNDQFLKGVAAGRNMPLARVAELADGRCHIGQAAVDLGLVDGICSLDETLAKLRQAAGVDSSTSRYGSRTMSAQAQAVQAGALPLATHAQIKAACPGCTSDFIVSQLEAGATLEQATRNYAAEQQQQLVAEKARAAAAEKELKQLKEAQTKRPGTKPVGNGKGKAKRPRMDDDGDEGDDEGDEDPMNADDCDDPEQVKAEWHRQVRIQMKRNGGQRMAAVRAVCRAQPELRRSLQLAFNDEEVHGRINSRFRKHYGI